MAAQPPKKPTTDEVTWRDSEEVEDLLGFDFGSAEFVDRSGLKALVNSALVSHRRLPMLEVIFDRTARLMTTSLRQLTDDNVEVTLDDVSSTRFGDFTQSVSQPAVIGVVHSAALDNYCLVAADAALVYSIVDLLLGGRRGGDALSIDDRGFTAIELGLAQRILSVLVEDLGHAFKPVADGAFTLDRLETTPRFAAIAQEASVCALAKFRVKLEERGGRASILIPHAALEPVRKTLLREFIGEASDAERVWREHLAAEVAAASVDLRIVLAEKTMTIGALKDLKIGETLVFKRPAAGAVDIKSGDTFLGRGRVGRSGDMVAVRLETAIARLPSEKGEAA
ncbi:MAG: FliM/FliN family flagellar motor switch protein [Parvularculaceae bacterium]